MEFTIIPRMFHDFGEFEDPDEFEFPNYFEDMFKIFGPTNCQPHMLCQRPNQNKLKRLQHKKYLQNKFKKMFEKLPEKCEGDETFNKSKLVVANKDDFTVQMNVQDFKPEEIAVKIVNDNILSIEAKHEETDGENGYVFRQVSRKFTIPNGFNVDKMTTKMTKDGMLAITAPKIVEENKEKDNEKIIPIERITED